MGLSDTCELVAFLLLVPTKQQIEGFRICPFNYQLIVIVQGANVEVSL